MALGLWSRGNLSLGIHFQNRWTSDDVLIRDLGCRFRQHDVHLSRNTSREAINLIIRVTGSDADLDGILLYAISFITLGRQINE